MSDEREIAVCNRPKLPRKPRWDPAKVRAAGYYLYFKEITEHLPNGRVRLVTGEELLMLGGYSYHGLGNDSRVISASKAALDSFGATTHGSRFLAGTTSLHRELEESLADFLGLEDAVTFVSGYVANVASIATLCGKGDLIWSEMRNHASLIDGARFSRASVVSIDFQRLQELPEPPIEPAFLIVTDGVFSMDGTVADLPSLLEVCKVHKANLYVDECHSAFVMGRTGRGLCEQNDIAPSSVDFHMGTLSKAIPSQGGYLAGSREFCELLRHEARGFIYSGAPSPPTVAAAIAGIKILEEEHWRFSEIDRKANLFRARLEQNGLNTGGSSTPIVPVILGSEHMAFSTALACHEVGIFVHAIIPPIVPPGTSRLRCSVMSTHRDEDLLSAADRIAEIVQSVSASLGEHRFTAFR